MPEDENIIYEGGISIQPSWERRDEIGIIPALRASLVELNTRPQATFSAIPVQGDWQGPALFAVTTSIASLVLYVMFHVGAVFAFFIIENGWKIPDFGPDVTSIFLFGTAAMIPILALFGASLPFLHGIFTHLILILYRQTTAGWLGTLRACFYAWGAAAPFLVLPTCIPIVFAIALYRYTYYAVLEVQHVPSNRAYAVAFFSLLFLAYAAFGQLGAAFLVAMALFRD